MPELYKYSYRVLRLDLTPGLTDYELAIDAEKVVYASPTDGPELSIRLQAKSNDQIPLRPQGEIVAPFQRLYISSGAVAKTVFLLIGSPKDIQLTGRDVAISGSLTAKTFVQENSQLGNLFQGSTYQTTSAVNSNKFQLFNPSNSEKTLMLHSYRIRTSNAGGQNWQLYRHTAPIGTLTTWVKSNLLLNSGPGVAELRELVDPSSPGTLMMPAGAIIFTPASTDVFSRPDFQVTLKPGNGFHIRAATIAAIANECEFIYSEF